ncbi:phosphotyrosine protein phosphatase [Candidatus Woesearchaeota archaeon]|nr:phosphotyrosine protein phosphatase [Candidatus Woesearchaeota archaeon]
MKLLFVCNQGKHRSKTAEELFKGRFETKSAGIYSLRPLTESKLLWADIIFVMEEIQRFEIGNKFHSVYLKKKIISLNIEDAYHYNQPELIDRLNESVHQFLYKR